MEAQVTQAHERVLELTREKEAREGELGVMRAEIARMENADYRWQREYALKLGG